MAKGQKLWFVHSLKLSSTTIKDPFQVQEYSICFKTDVNSIKIPDNQEEREVEIFSYFHQPVQVKICVEVNVSTNSMYWYTCDKTYLYSLRTCTRGKVIGSVVIVIGVVVDTIIAKSQKNMPWTEYSMPLNGRKSQKTVYVPSNHLCQRPTSTTIMRFFSGCAYQPHLPCHVL